MLFRSIKASLVNVPKRIEIGFLKLADLKGHADIVAGERDLAGPYSVENGLLWSDECYGDISPMIDAEGG